MARGGRRGVVLRSPTTPNLAPQQGPKESKSEQRRKRKTEGQNPGPQGPDRPPGGTPPPGEKQRNCARMGTEIQIGEKTEKIIDFGLALWANPPHELGHTLVVGAFALLWVCVLHKTGMGGGAAGGANKRKEE